jgi:uncharacterized protein (TIGR02271 family)
MSKRNSSGRATPENRTSASSVTMPVVSEDVTVQTRRVERAKVRISKTVEEEQVTVHSEVARSEVSIERVPVDRFIEQPVSVRQEGDTLIIPVLEEVPVVVMKMKLKEEVRVTTRIIAQPHPMQVAVRRESVSTERIPVDTQEEQTFKEEERGTSQ